MSGHIQGSYEKHKELKAAQGIKITAQVCFLETVLYSLDSVGVLIMPLCALNMI